MTGNKPQLYYSVEELEMYFERHLRQQIYNEQPIRLAFMFETNYMYIAPTDTSMFIVTYLPLTFINPDGSSELFYVAEGTENLFKGIGRK